MNKHILRAVAIAALAGSAFAGTTTQTQATTPGIVAGTPNTGGTSLNFNQNLVFAPFVPGTLSIPGNAFLTGVQYTLTGQSYVLYSITTPSDGTTQVTVSFVGTLTGGNSIQVTSPSSQVTGVNTSASLNTVGPQSNKTTPVTSVGSGTVNDTASFYTSGTPTFAVRGQGISGLQASGGVTGSNDTLGAASVTLTYLWDVPAVPEASTYASGAVLLAGVGFIARRRMAKA